MSIQSNVNQMLGMASLLATQHPAIREHAAKRQHVRALETKADTLEKALKTADVNDTGPLGDELIATRKALFETDPTKWRYDEYTNLKPKHVMTAGEDDVPSAAEDPEGFVAAKDDVIQEKVQSEYEDQLLKTEVENRLKGMVNPQEEIKQDMANASALTKADAKQRQRKSFLNYMKETNPETSLGYSFNEFPEHLQKAIVKQIPSKDRRKMMKETESNG